MRSHSCFSVADFCTVLTSAGALFIKSNVLMNFGMLQSFIVKFLYKLDRQSVLIIFIDNSHTSCSKSVSESSKTEWLSGLSSVSAPRISNALSIFEALSENTNEICVGFLPKHSCMDLYFSVIRLTVCGWQNSPIASVLWLTHSLSKL